MIFGVLILALLATGTVGALILTGTIDSPFDRKFTESAASPYADINPPCLPEGTMPAPAGEIQVNVLNTSDRKGLATAIAQELGYRGYSSAEAKNALGNDSDQGQTQIRFGSGGMAQGYTVAAQFPTRIILLDDRPAEDVSVDVVVGSGFDDLVPVPDGGTVLDMNVPLQNVKGCVAIDKVDPLPMMPQPSPTPVEDEAVVPEPEG